MEEIAARVAAVRGGVERRRYGGEDPLVEVTPDLPAGEIVARTLGAERAAALLAIGGGRFDPGQDLAEAALWGAVGALRSWSFALARARFDEAGARAHDPVLQQRIALFKALTRFLAAVVYTPLEEKPRGARLDDLDETLGGLDCLPEGERLHYRDEADRLLNLRDAAAGGDAALDAAWTLVRAQLAMAAGQDEAALLWLLRLAARHLPASAGTPGAADAYLADLIARARAQILALIGAPEPAAAATGGEARGAGEAKPVHPRDLFNALVARLGAALDRDLARGMDQFALTEWVEPEVATAGRRGAKRGSRREGNGP